MYITPLSSNNFGRSMAFASSKTAVAEKAVDTLRTIKFALPAKKPNQVVNFEVTGDIAKNLINKADRTNITSLKYSDGECERIFQNKQGFSEKRFKQIQENIQKVVDDGVNFLYELIRAQHSYNK